VSLSGHFYEKHRAIRLKESLWAPRNGRCATLKQAKAFIEITDRIATATRSNDDAVAVPGLEESGVETNPRYKLDDLVSGIQANNIHAEIPVSEWSPTIGQPEAANSNDCATVCDPSLVKPLRQPKYTLDGMLAGVTEASRHEEIGRYVGPPQYRLLRTILEAAFAHAATGKGKERHARDLPFDKQPMLETTRLVGPGFPLGQAIKKAGEAAGMIERSEYSAAEAECLGAINYLAGAVAWMRERKEGKVAA